MCVCVSSGARLGETGGQISGLPGAGPVRHSLQEPPARIRSRQTPVPDLQDILHDGPRARQTQTAHFQLPEPVRMGPQPVSAPGADRLPTQTQTFPQNLNEN